jgi:hypothetical protein
MRGPLFIAFLGVAVAVCFCGPGNAQQQFTCKETLPR